MTEHYRFFNSTEGDIREYNANEFAEYFNRFVSDGIFSEGGSLGLKVTNTSGMSISVAPGYAFIKGYMYKNDAGRPFTLDNADATLDRIDRVVLRFDEVNRIINLAVKKGTLASSPIPPTLINTSTLKELSLSQIRIKKGATSISVADVTDERLTEFCGQVSMLIDVPVNDMWNIYNNTLSQIEEKWTMDKNAVNNEWDILKSQFDDWFSGKQLMAGGLVFSGVIEPTEAVAGDYWFKELV